MNVNSFKVGEVTVVPDKNEIITLQGVVRIEHRLIQLLQVLANAAGNAVSKQEIAEKVWAPKTMSDESLAQAISQLRKYLGDSAAVADIIQTIPKTGYALIAPVEWAAPPPSVLGPENHDRSFQVQLLMGILCAILAVMLLLEFEDTEEIEIEEIEIELNDSISL